MTASVINSAVKAHGRVPPPHMAQSLKEKLHSDFQREMYAAMHESMLTFAGKIPTSEELSTFCLISAAQGMASFSTAWAPPISEPWETSWRRDRRRCFAEKTNQNIVLAEKTS